MNTTARSAPSRPAAPRPASRHGAITAVVCVALEAVMATAEPAPKIASPASSARRRP